MIVDLKQQLVSMQCSQTVKLKELKEEQSDFLAQFDRLRQSVNHNQARDKAKLTILAVVSSDVIKVAYHLYQKQNSNINKKTYNPYTNLELNPKIKEAYLPNTLLSQQPFVLCKFSVIFENFLFPS